MVGRAPGGNGCPGSLEVTALRWLRGHSWLNSWFCREGPPRSAGSAVTTPRQGPPLETAAGMPAAPRSYAAFSATFHHREEKRDGADERARERGGGIPLEARVVSRPLLRSPGVPLPPQPPSPSSIARSPLRVRRLVLSLFQPRVIADFFAALFRRGNRLILTGRRTRTLLAPLVVPLAHSRRNNIAACVERAGPCVNLKERPTDRTTTFNVSD